MKFTRAQQRFIVIRVAMFEKASDIIQDFKEAFPGADLIRQRVFDYDCSKTANRAVRSQELIDLFDQTRDEFRQQTEAVPIANKAWRLKEYQQLYEKAKAGGQNKQTLIILKQAAEDHGDVYSNKRDITSNGATIKGYGAEVDFEEI